MEQSTSFFANPMFPLLLMVPVFYFLIWRPQSQERKRVQKMLEAIKKGDQVLTSSGMYGVVSAVEGDRISVKVAENVKIDFQKSAISKVIEEKKEG